MRSTSPPPELEETHLVQERDGVRLFVHRAWSSALPVAQMLAGAPLEAWGRPVGEPLQGREPVHVLATAAGEIVAKTYSRGGLLGGLARHRYADPWRPAREAVVAEALRQRGVETPVVVAGRATRNGPTSFRLEIATARVPGARDLLEALLEARDDVAQARVLAAATGALLRRLHDAGLRHRDLQVKNVLVSDEDQPAPRFHVIDLDRCTLGAPLRVGERIGSLARFVRSLVKRGLLPGVVRREPPHLPWRPSRAFVDGYGALDGLERAALLARLAGRLRRSLPAHELLWRR